jgi:hypothetical protein
MSAGIILAIAIGIATALVVALIAARRAGDTLGPEANYGRELDVPVGARFGSRTRPGVRPRAILAIIAAALVAFGAGVATYLSNGSH